MTVAATGGRASAVALAIAVAVVAAAAGCGDDLAVPMQEQPVRPTAAATPGAAARGRGARNQLVEKPHIEDRVRCPIPDQPTDPERGACDPKAPSCGEHLYCLPLAQGSYCEPCPERDGIRHAFREHDFDPEQNRDPFQSFLLRHVPAAPPGLTRKCRHRDQRVATRSSYADLKLVGIVAQGAERRALMMGGPRSYLVKRGDCVGKERAVVTDIGISYVTFLLDPEGSARGPRAPREYSVQLDPR